MKDIALTSDDELRFENGDLVLLEDTPGSADALAQSIKVGLRVFRGEAFNDLQFGMPYVESFFVKGYSPSLIRGLVRAFLESRPGIATVDELDFDFPGSGSRTLSITGRVTSSQGYEVTIGTTITGA